MARAISLPVKRAVMAETRGVDATTRLEETLRRAAEARDIPRTMFWGRQASGLMWGKLAARTWAPSPTPVVIGNG
eukprot:3820152-Pyramimonas_sp.AAC.1